MKHLFRLASYLDTVGKFTLADKITKIAIDQSDFDLPNKPETFSDRVLRRSRDTGLDPLFRHSERRRAQGQGEHASFAPPMGRLAGQPRRISPRHKETAGKRPSVGDNVVSAAGRDSKVGRDALLVHSSSRVREREKRQELKERQRAKRETRAKKRDKELKERQGLKRETKS